MTDIYVILYNSLICMYTNICYIYVMTDFTQSNFNFWSQHPSLKAYFDSGRLDAVRYVYIHVYIWVYTY